jgi:predicted acylesterase/phospholipase RssA
MKPDLALTLAGGGNRAFYQTGLLNRWGARLFPRLRVVATCSAGACVATLHFAQRSVDAGAFWRRRRDGVVRNIDPLRLLKRQPMAPHGAVYRDTMIFGMQEGGLERLRALPFPLLVLTAALPKWAPAPLAVLLGIAAYNVEKRLSPERVHPTFGRRLGFHPVVYDARKCETPEDVADLVLASSATPPFTPVGRIGTRRLLDGGMVDNVPAFVAEEHEGVSRHLVVLTRPYPAGVIGRRGQRLYVGPLTPTPVSRWDYTRPELVDATIAMGERDSEVHRAALDALLAEG